MKRRKVVKTTNPHASHLFSASSNLNANKTQYQMLKKANGVRIRKQTKSFSKFLLSFVEMGRMSHWRKETIRKWFFLFTFIKNDDFMQFTWENERSSFSIVNSKLQISHRFELDCDNHFSRHDRCIRPMVPEQLHGCKRGSRLLSAE